MRGETLLDVGHDGLDGLLALGLLGRGELLDLGFGGADGQAFLDDESGDEHAVRGVLDAEQGLGVTGGKLALAEETLDVVVEGEEADAVGDRRAGLAEALGDGVLREVEVAHERGEAEGFIDRIEVGSLEVLDEREHGAGSVAGLEDAGGDGLLADQLEGAEAALTGDEFVALLHLTDDDRLHEAFRTDRVGEFLDLGVVEIAARLAGIRDDRGQRQLLQQETRSDRRRGRGGRLRGGGLGGGLGGLDASADERTETATEGFLRRSGHGALL